MQIAPCFNPRNPCERVTGGLQNHVRQKVCDSRLFAIMADSFGVCSYKWPKNKPLCLYLWHYAVSSSKKSSRHHCREDKSIKTLYVQAHGRPHTIGADDFIIHFRQQNRSPWEPMGHSICWQRKGLERHRRTPLCRVQHSYNMYPGNRQSERTAIAELAAGYRALKLKILIIPWTGDTMPVIWRWRYAESGSDQTQ